MPGEEYFYAITDGRDEAIALRGQMQAIQGNK